MLLNISTPLIDTLISSKTRIKLLLKFFLNSNTQAYLRSLEEEFKESTNGIRLELNRLESAKMLESSTIGNKKFYQVNTKHPLFADIHKIILKHVGIDQMITSIVHKLGQLQKVYLKGTLAQGLDSNTLELIFVGDIDEAYLQQLVPKCEALIQRKIEIELVNSAAYDEQNYSNNLLYVLCWNQS